MHETGLRFRGLAQGGRAQHSGEGVRGALRLSLYPRRIGGIRSREAAPRFLDLLAVIGVVGVALAVDLVADQSLVIGGAQAKICGTPPQCMRSRRRIDRRPDLQD